MKKSLLISILFFTSISFANVLDISQVETACQRYFVKQARPDESAEYFMAKLAASTDFAVVAQAVNPFTGDVTSPNGTVVFSLFGESMRTDGLDENAISSQRARLAELYFRNFDFSIAHMNDYFEKVFAAISDSAEANYVLPVYEKHFYQILKLTYERARRTLDPYAFQRSHFNNLPAHFLARALTMERSNFTKPELHDFFLEYDRNNTWILPLLKKIDESPYGPTSDKREIMREKLALRFDPEKSFYISQFDTQPGLLRFLYTLKYESAPAEFLKLIHDRALAHGVYIEKAQLKVRRLQAEAPPVSSKKISKAKAELSKRVEAYGFFLNELKDILNDDPSVDGELGRLAQAYTFRPLSYFQ